MISDYKNKKIAIIGLARSGFASACLLNDLGASVFVTDSVKNDNIIKHANLLKERGIAVEVGGHTKNFIRGKDLIVVSPGVSNDSQVLIWAEEFSIPVIGEIELAWSVCPATIIAITGTNGKTTTTTLLSKVLEAYGFCAPALGNIGNPFSLMAATLKPSDFVSLEVSSFQLERIKNFKPKVAAILNFAQNHLDKNHRGHSDMSQYLLAKKRIFMNQDETDYLLLNYSDRLLRDLGSEARSKIVFFNKDELRDNSKLNLNPNHLAVIALSAIFGVPRDLCLEVFRNFNGVEHRMEHVRNIKGVEFINDSKATNVDSTIWALENIAGNVILIAGGRDKNIDYSIISDYLKAKVKLLIVIGEAKEKIVRAFSAIVPIQEASTLEEAVYISHKKASAGDCVLLSPMCASFDMFNDFEHRGRVFKEIVNGL